VSAISRSGSRHARRSIDIRTCPWTVLERRTTMASASASIATTTPVNSSGCATLSSISSQTMNSAAARSASRAALVAPTT
jgi:hypothetical protein